MSAVLEAIAQELSDLDQQIEAHYAAAQAAERKRDKLLAFRHNYSNDDDAVEAPASPRKQRKITGVGVSMRDRQSHSEREDGLYYDSPEVLEDIERAIAGVEGPAARKQIFEGMTIELSPSTFMRSARLLSAEGRVIVTGDGRGRRYQLPVVVEKPAAPVSEAAEMRAAAMSPDSPPMPADETLVEPEPPAGESIEPPADVQQVYCASCDEKSIDIGAKRCSWCDGPLTAVEVAA